MKEKIYTVEDTIDIPFNEKAKKRALDLMAYDMFKRLNEQGIVTDQELKYLKKKYNITVDYWLCIIYTYVNFSREYIT